jgi:hypothetical protein
MKHLIIGIIKLSYIIVGLVVTMPIWVWIFAYDLSAGTDKFSEFCEECHFFD